MSTAIRSFGGLVLVCVLTAAAGPASGAGPVLAVTADTEGAIQSNPDGAGGLARRAAALAGAAEAPRLLVDAGNTFFGPDSLSRSPKAVVAAYDAIGYDAVNISHRDFRLGKAATLEALKDARFACVSANLIDERTGRPLFKPFVVKKAGATRLAVVGVTDLSPAVAALPHMRKQLEGVKIVPAAEALADVLPQARAQADRVVLLYYGSQAGLAAVREKFGADLSAIAAGGVRPELLPAAGGPPVLAVHNLGVDLAVLPLAQENAQPKLVKVDTSIPPDPQVAKAVEAALPAAAGPAEPKPAPDGADKPLPALQPGKMNPLDLAGESKGLRLRVTGVQVAEERGQVRAGPPGRLIVLQTQWINRLDRQFEIPNPARHVYLIVNGSRIAALHPQARAIPGHVSTDRIVMPGTGSIVKGEMVFQTSQSEVRSLELRFFETQYGNIALPLVEGPAQGQARPLAGPAGNGAVELAVFSMHRSDSLAGKNAPPGLTYLVLDLRGQSLARGQNLALADLPEWSRYTYLVADGQYAYPASPSPDWPERQRLLPGLLTGGEVAFLAPQKAACLELRMDSPSLERGPTPASAAIVLPLEGARPQTPEPPHLAEAVDEMFRVRILSQATLPSPAGQKAADKTRLLLLELSVTNAGKTGQWFQPAQQVKYLTMKDAALEMSDLSARCLRPCGRTVWVPAGQRRVFQMVFRVPAEEKTAHVRFTGGRSMQTLSLKPIEPAPATPGEGETPQVAVNPQPKPQPVPAEPAQPPASKPETPATPVQPLQPKPVEPTKPTEPPPAGPRTAGHQETLTAPKAGQVPLVKVGDVTVFDPALSPKGLAGVGLTQEQVDAAVLRGRQFLWRYLQTWMKKDQPQTFERSEHLLCLYALAHAGEFETPLFVKSLKQTLKQIEPKVLHTNYEAALAAMLSDALNDPDSLQALRAALRHILETQCEIGTWNYSGANTKATQQIRELMEADRRDARGFGAQPLRRISPWNLAHKSGDNSVTQFSVLGLWAARRQGLPVDSDIWTRCLGETRKLQHTDGSLAYRTGKGYSSMTCAFVCTSAICLRQLGQDPIRDEAIHKALAWLIRNWTLENNPAHNGYHYYYLYSLERVGGCLGIEFIGPNEWYPLGARYLLDHQKPNGSWEVRSENSFLATSFALLFLTRATARPVAPPAVPGTLETFALRRAPERVYIILDASSSMLADAAEGKTKFQAAQEAIETIVRELPDSTQVALRVYGNRFKDAPGGPSEDTTLEIPMGKLNKTAFAARIKSLYPRGKTPLALSLEKAAQDLSRLDVRPDRPVSVVLLTDGWEDTAAKRDPVAAAKAYTALSGATLQVMAFDVDDPPAIKQLQDIALAAGGRYWPLSKLDHLATRLRSTIWAAAGDFEVLDEQGKKAGKGAFGQAIPLKPGKYVLTTRWDGRDLSLPLEIQSEKTVSVTLDPSRPSSPLSVGSAPGGK